MHPHRLIALPVAGQSFLLQRNGKNILFDGGYSSGRLISALLAADVNVSRLDIVVCSHADRDHAGGLKDLLGTSMISVGEIWLPGEWGDSLGELLNDPQAVVDALVDEFRDFEAPELDYSPAKSDDIDEVERQAYSIINRLREQRIRSQGRDSRLVDGGGAGLSGLRWLHEIANEARQRGEKSKDKNRLSYQEKASKIFQNGIRRIRYRQSRRGLDEIWAEIWIAAMNAAEIIRHIALQAVENKVKVRWFDFDEFMQRGCRPSGGVENLLIPLNAVEIKMPSAPAVGIGYLVRLSPANERSLAFLSTQADSLSPVDVIFTSDSPMGYGPGYKMSFLVRRPRQGFAIVTAPHHGSESNAVAYEHINTCWYVSLWLRSGGTKKHPGQTFQDVSPELRACTHCPQRARGMQLSEVQIRDSLWPLLRVKSHYCDCGTV